MKDLPTLQRKGQGGNQKIGVTGLTCSSNFFQ